MQSRLSREPTARIMSGIHCVCFAPGGETLFEEGVFTSVLAAPAPLPLMRSSGCARRWISEWLTAFNFEELCILFI